MLSEILSAYILYYLCSFEVKSSCISPSLGADHTGHLVPTNVGRAAEAIAHGLGEVEQSTVGSRRTAGYGR